MSYSRCLSKCLFGRSFVKETVERARAHMQNVQVDWISGLPDDLLIRILSFLTTKETVQMCILSKRWKRVWAHLPILEFNINQFGINDSIGGSFEALRKSIARFEKFANTVVENREPTHLDRVCYVHHTRVTGFYKFPMQWLDRVTLLMPRLIDISIDRVDSLDLPDSVFSCATLQHLKIELNTVKTTTVIPATIYLPSLKIFDIRGVELDDKFAQNLLMCCPSLETLKIHNCNLYFSNISSNKLKTLEIIRCCPYEPMQISCPSLFSLFIHSCDKVAGISLKCMKSLRRAGIELSCMAPYFGGGSVSVLNCISAISNATELTLYILDPELKVQLERDLVNCRNFYNLKGLFISSWGMNFDFNLVAALLKVSPNVEKLCLIVDMNKIAIQEEHRQEVLGNVLFQHKYMETVKIFDVHRRKFPQVFIQNLIQTLNTYIKEIGNVIIK